MSRFTKFAAVAILTVAGLSFGGSTASAAERSTPVQTAYRGYHGWRNHDRHDWDHSGWNRGGRHHGGWDHQRWYRR